MEAYFQNINQQWIKKENSSMLSAKKLTDEAYQELIRLKIVEFEIEEPAM